MIRTNYAYQNWVELVIFFSVFLTIIFVPIITYVEFFFFPVLDGHLMFLTFMNNDGIIERYSEHLQEEIINENIILDEFYAALLSMIVVVLAPLFLVFPILVLAWLFTPIAYWTCKKIHILPILQLVIIRNGKGTTMLRFRQ